jgi:sugar phosphate isomerase/epimerase
MSLSLSLISSFVQTGLNALRAEDWPRFTPSVELYTFMDLDLHFLTGDDGNRPVGLNACQALAQLQDCSAAAGRLDKYFKNRGFRIGAFSSFLPEIMLPDNPITEDGPHIWQQAQEALKSLVKLARELRALNHPVKAIELVGGSAVRAMWRGKNTRDEEVFVLNRLNPSDAVYQLIRRLEPVAKVAAEGDPVLLALELEPGPLFTLGNRTGTLQFCRWIDTDGGCSDAMRRVVGVNLDVAHWALLDGISVDWVRSQPSLLNRITHAHISGHSKGHFGDIEPTPEMLAKFKPWIGLLHELAAGQHRWPNGPAFSGYISCELECCRDTCVVDVAMGRLLGILQQPAL